ncbi:MAG: RNA polymerase sigma factor [Acidimicrobiales bacterium]
MADLVARREYERFFEFAKDSLMQQAFLLTGDVEESRDLVQEVLLRVWREWTRVSALDNPQAWARRVLHNLAIGRWRHDRYRRGFHLGVVQKATADPGVGHLDVVNALHHLPARQQRALVLHDVVGLTAREVATELGVPEGTIRSWLSRGRALIAIEIELTSAPTVKGTQS